MPCWSWRPLESGKLEMRQEGGNEQMKCTECGTATKARCESYRYVTFSAQAPAERPRDDIS